MTKCEVTFSVIIYVIKNDYHICVFSKSLYQYFMLWVHKILNWIKAQQHRTYDIEMCVYNNCVCYMCMLKSYQGIKCTWMYIPNHTISRFAYHFFSFSHHIVHIINVQTRKEIVFYIWKIKYVIFLPSVGWRIEMTSLWKLCDFVVAFGTDKSNF